MATYFITGAGRGIGLGLVRLLSQQPPTRVATIFAGTRKQPSPSLQEIISISGGRVVHIELETTSQSSIDRAVAEINSQLGEAGLDVLVNNAGIMPSTPGGIQSMHRDVLNNAIDVNVTAVHSVTVACLPLLQKGQGKTVINMSSAVGSITQSKDHMLPVPAYKISKAALNMMTAHYAAQFDSEGFTFLAINPGWIQTDMGSTNADIDYETGISAVATLIINVERKDNGKFRNVKVPGWVNSHGQDKYDGGDILW